MRVLVITVLLVCWTSSLKAQDLADASTDMVEAEFPGGYDQLHESVQGALKYPATAKKKKIEGIVDLELHLDEFGQVSSIKVKKGLHADCDRSAIEAVKSIGQWQPARLNGEAISSVVEVPVVFFIAKKSKKKPKKKKRN